jgi:hypothetical protein
MSVRLSFPAAGQHLPSEFIGYDRQAYAAIPPGGMKSTTTAKRLCPNQKTNVIPAQAGIQALNSIFKTTGCPALAGMTKHQIGRLGF